MGAGELVVGLEAMEENEMIKMGSKVKDTISGLTGVVVGRFEYLYGCVRIAIQPQELKDGKPIDAQVVDEAQCKVIEEVAKGVQQPSAERLATKPAGPRDTPTARLAPRR